MVKTLPAMQETWVWSLGWEDLLGEGMATHSSTFGWRIPWTEGPGGFLVSQRVRHDWATKHRAQRFINDRTTAPVSAAFRILAPARSLMWVHGVSSEFLPASVLSCFNSDTIPVVAALSTCLSPLVCFSHRRENCPVGPQAAFLGFSSS